MSYRPDRIVERPTLSVALALDSLVVDAHVAIVSPRLGFPFLLTELLLQAGAGVGTLYWLQLYVAPDNDITDPQNLTGEPLIQHRGEYRANRPIRPWWRAGHPFVIALNRLVPQAGRFLKLHIHSDNTSHHFLALCTLAILQDGDYA